jgi:glycosyltransferase involved in cell wall biosynthesis
LTGGFPYGKGETFLETEIVFLARKFTTIHIIALDCTTSHKRDLPKNVSSENFNVPNSILTKILALRFLVNKLFWKELLIIKISYNKSVSLSILKTMLISLARANSINKKLSGYIHKDNNLVLYSYWCDDSALAIAFEKSKNKKTIGITRIHRWDVYFEESQINYLPFRQFIANNCNMIYAISKDGMYSAIREWQINPNKIQVSRLGISNKFKIKLDKSKKTFHITSCSNIIAIKRVHLIAEALTNLKDINLKWTHFGNGPERERIESVIKKIPKSIEVILKGSVSNHAIYSFYNIERPNLFINVSSSEGVPVSIMEAMSFGTPVIATNVGGNSEIVTHQNGYLLEVDPTPEKVAETIELFYNLSIDEKNKLRKIAYETWETEYNAKKNYAQFTAEVLSL